MRHRAQSKKIWAMGKYGQKSKMKPEADKQ